MVESAGDILVMKAKALLGVILLFEENHSDPDRGLSLLKESSSSDSDGDIFSVLSRVYYETAMLAMLYYFGEVVDEDLKKALALATGAAEDDEPSAQGLLAYMYFDGYGVKEDHRIAEGWARRAVDQGNELGWFE